MRITKRTKTSLLLVFIVILLSSCQPSSKKTIEDSKATGDWPVYSFEELVSNSDLIVYGEITNTENVDGSPSSQVSKMSVLKVLKGSEKNKLIPIKLSDPKYYVKPKAKYIMFLSKEDSYYTQKTYNSLLIENDGIISSALQGLQGDFKTDEVQKKILDALTKL
ncbi:hypothetical protein J2Z69_000722 [Paenibacillus shirakamiensis]|uniref:Lipoprotein n=1 Tax=Paenibacillus shirakamiensis TaxID=1265935 RepID=A0ABS4JDB5_9BACL|nr:hypothetical protein [Paenibacillus shirakamiensis]MBP1999703.1 hypothetical protein [Paenibacillus shirakamiensis]